jgi:hypothetical protein
MEDVVEVHLIVLVLGCSVRSGFPAQGWIVE